MAGISNAEHLRQWLLGCGAIDGTKRFGVDWLGDGAYGYALFTVPSPLRWKENVLGECRPAVEQAQDFLFEVQACYGADAAQNLANLALCQDVMNWIVTRNEARDFPRWEGGVVTGITPTLTGAPIAFRTGRARYQIQIRVNYRME
jgi:hypothetical protein